MITVTQKMLIKALLGNDQQCIRWWKQWKKSVKRYDTLDEGSLQLFPLAYRRLLKLLPDDSWLPVTKNAYQAHWLKNQLLYHQLEVVLDVLDKQKIPSLVIKGTALIPLYYDSDKGLRRVEDIDIWVPITRFKRVITLLKQQGWKVEAWQNSDTFEPEFFHSLSLIKNGLVIDVHCHLLHFYLGADDWSLFLSAAQTTSVNHYQFQTLSDSDHLVHLCIHGLRGGERSRQQWMVDSLLILRSKPIDWSRVVMVSQATQLPQVVGMALKYLQTEFKQKIPRSVIDELLHAPMKLSYQRLFWLNTRDIEAHVVATLETYWWTYFNSLNGDYSVAQLTKKLALYLQHLTQTKHVLQFPKIMTKRVHKLAERSVKAKLSDRRL